MLYMKTPEEWDKEFSHIIHTETWDSEDPYSERECHNRIDTYVYEIREERLKIIKKIQNEIVYSSKN